MIGQSHEFPLQLPPSRLASPGNRKGESRGNSKPPTKTFIRDLSVFLSSLIFGPPFYEGGLWGGGFLARLSRPSGGKNLQLSVRIKKMSPPLPFSHKGNFFFALGLQERKKNKM